MILSKEESHDNAGDDQDVQGASSPSASHRASVASAAPITAATSITHNIINSHPLSTPPPPTQQKKVSQQVIITGNTEREVRRRRRRQIRRLLTPHLSQRPTAAALPSFLAVVQSEPTTYDDNNNDDDDDEELLAPPYVVIDIDAYLGFKAKQQQQQHLHPPPETVSSSSPSLLSSSEPTDVSRPYPGRSRSTPTATVPVSSSTAAGDTMTVTTTTSNNTTTKIIATPTPAEEGFYEGSRTMALSEDGTYLGDMHVAVRQHLEYFSATQADVDQSHAGRRTKVLFGQVGIRCIHCARHVLSHNHPQPSLQESKEDNHNNNTKNTDKVSWPAGAVSYPVKFEGLYSTASQKPQLHFESCPYLPQDSALALMIQEARANQRSNGTDGMGGGTGSGLPLTGLGKRKRMVQGVSGLMYYVISCQRIGMQEIPGGNGMRFTRDLSLEPLDFEPIRTKLELERPDLIPRQYQSKPSRILSSQPWSKVPRLIAGPDDALSTAPHTTLSTPFAHSESNAETQAVLQKAFQEVGEAQHALLRVSDRGSLTDYMFLAISQMALCWASPQDFVARGKKTKTMRLGLAGFCCRHCQHEASAYSCRSYSSAADNLASAISNSFVAHMQKCPYTPREIQVALSVCKRIHTRQMSQMPYGSQRKVFFAVWDRLRAADQPPPEGLPDNHNADNDDDNEGDVSEEASAFEGRTQGRKRKNVDEEDWDPEQDGILEEHEGDADDLDGPKRRMQPAPLASPLTMNVDHPNARGSDFPISTDPEVQAVLKAAEETWDTTQNDDLILPEDRYLVSDYVFLTMRQLRIAMPQPFDFRGHRRSNVLNHMPGLCCIHCADDPTVSTPSGRSFPSAPDNMASALNTSFYNHMQYCRHLDPAIRRSLVPLRKIHSQQCSSMTFGSQRRFFAKVFGKLKAAPMTNDGLGSVAPTKSGGSPEPDIFRENDFVECGTAEIPFWQCVKCRMVPFEFRAVGGVHYVRPISAHMKQHRSICREDGIHMGWAQIAVRKMCATYESDQLLDAMKPLIEFVVCHDPDLAHLFLGCVAARGQAMDTLHQMDTRGWWRRLPYSVDSMQLQSIFESSATLLELPSSTLSDHPSILRVLEIMSPCLQYYKPGALAVTEDPSPEISAEERGSPPLSIQDESSAPVAETIVGDDGLMSNDSIHSTVQSPDTL